MVHATVHACLPIMKHLASCTSTATVDYSPILTTLIFPRNSGDQTEIFFSVPLMDDLLIEDQETFKLSASISVPPRGLGGVFSPDGDEAIGIIDNDDGECVSDPMHVYLER